MTPSKIIDNIYLGDMNNAYFNPDKYVIVNISKDIPIYNKNRRSLRIPIDDDPSENILMYKNVFLDFIDENKSYPILVHCFAGISRSPSFVIMYLMCKKGCNFDQAYKFVKAKRFIVSPNDGFIKQLRYLNNTKESNL